VAQAESVARAMLFPPRGDRGSGGTGRAGRWGLLPRDEYLRRGDATLCIPQLESAEAIEAAPGILAVDGVDAVFLGAADLALSIGDPPAVPGLLRSALAAARAAGKPCGAAAVDAERGAEAIEQGYGFVLIGNDGGMLAKTARAMLGDLRARLTAAGDG
jgi:2-dehydro-3-deoxyglucarate aldolase/4-hydroxy-2-oxoheptanedioate aldolase